MPTDTRSKSKRYTKASGKSISTTKEYDSADEEDCVCSICGEM